MLASVAVASAAAGRLACPWRPGLASLAPTTCHNRPCSLEPYQAVASAAGTAADRPSCLEPDMAVVSAAGSTGIRSSSAFAVNRNRGLH